MVATNTDSHYILLTFINACSLKGAVIMTKAAKGDAKENFNLETEERALKFIASGGLEDLKFINTLPLGHGAPPKDIGKAVDAYDFKTGPKYGYIAFYKNFKGIWVVKSFHPPKHGPNAGQLTHTPFQQLENLKR